MAYRHEEEGLRARIERLERDFAEARGIIAQLRGDLPSEPHDAGKVDRLIGVVTRLERHVELPFEVSEQGLLAVADFLVERIPGGVASQIAGTLTHRKGSYEMRIAPTRAGSTAIRLGGDYRTARTHLWLGAPGICLLSAVFFALPAAGLGGGAIGVALAACAGVVSGFLFLRGLIRRAMVADQRRLISAFHRVVELAEQYPVQRARIGEAERAAEHESADDDDVSELGAQRKLAH